MAAVPSSIRHLGASLILALSLAGIVLSAPPSSTRFHHNRSKRHILQMCELIVSHTNRGCFDYYNYGCYCGLGNAASGHVDGVDGCCRIHDQCYGEVACFWMYPQVVGYSFTWENELARCTDHPISSACQYTTCQCDLDFARCLSRQRYNHRFRNFDRRQCRGERPRVIRHRRSSKAAGFWEALAGWES